MYASDVGVRQDSASLVALDLANVDTLTGAENYTGVVISCRKFDPCVVARDEDDAGKPAGVEVYSDSGGAGRHAALSELGPSAAKRRLSPAGTGMR